MAGIGMYGVFYAKAVVQNGVVTGYTGGTRTMGKAISASFEPNTPDDNPLYANNAEAENDSSGASGGALTLTTDNKGYIKSGSTVEMRRRVAGLSAHLRLNNFPDDETIGGVAIMLWDEQNQSVPTLEKTWQLPNFTDFTYDPLETPDANPQDQSVCLLWMTEPETDTQAYSEATSDYTCQGSAYVLPKPAPEAGSTDYTLAVVVYNAENKVICTKRAALAEDGYLIFDTSLGTGIIDDGSFYRYPIVANRFYRFGDDKPLDVVYDPQNPFEILIDPNWEGKPNMGVDDYNPDTDNQ